MSTRNSIELILLAALWGASFLFMRIATPEFGPVVLIEIRVLLAGLILLPFWFVRENTLSRSNAVSCWKSLFVVGALNSAIPFVLFAFSTLYITGGYAAILNATAPIWAALVAWMWLRKRVHLSSALGLLVGLLGVIMLVSGSMNWSLDGVTLGVLAALSAPLLYGIAANYTSEYLSHISPLSIATLTQLTAAALLLPACFFFLPSEPISIAAWLSVIALALLCTSLAYLLYFRLIANVGSTKAITVTFLLPIFGSLWGALFIDEQITLRMVVGAVVILIGTALVIGVIKPLKESKQ